MQAVHCRRLLRGFLLLGRAVAVDAPVLLNAKGGGGVLLPVVVEGGEQDEVVGEVVLEVLDGGLLVLEAGDSLAVGATSGGPAGLGDDDLAVGVAAGLGDALGLLEDPLAGLLGGDAAVEEGVAVSGGVVADGAELGVVDDGDKGVDGDDGTLVLAGEARLGGVDGSLDVPDAVLAIVNALVADGDGVDDAPVAVGVLLDGSLQLLDLALDAVDLEETGKDLHVLGLGGLDDGTGLVAVNAVHANHAVAVEGGEVLGDLVARLARLVRVVGRVGDAVAGALGGVVVAGGRRGGSLGRRVVLGLAGRRSRGGVGGSRGLVCRRRGLVLGSRRSLLLGSGSLVLGSLGGGSGLGLVDLVAVLVDVDHLGGGGHVGDIGDGGVLDGLLLLVTVLVGAVLGLGHGDGRQSGDAEESGLHFD